MVSVGKVLSLDNRKFWLCIDGLFSHLTKKVLASHIAWAMSIPAEASKVKLWIPQTKSNRCRCSIDKKLLLTIFNLLELATK